MKKLGRIKFTCYKVLPNGVKELFRVITDRGNAEKAMTEYRNRGYDII